MAHVFEKKWRSQDVRLRENVDFSALLLSERVIDGLNNAGFKKPSPIQLEAIPMGRFGKDLMVQAKSGTGKTLVFVIVALEMLKRKLFRPQVLIIVPTREIATQICSVVKAVGSAFPKLICSSFIGGLPLFEDKEKAVTSQIVVGTPGRLRHLIQLKALPTNSIRLLVFDEADELLECASFTEDIEEIFNALPDDKQVIATSATFSPKNRKLMLRYLRDPHLVRLNAKELALLGMVHYAEIVEFCPMPVIMYRLKLAALEKILKTVKFAQCLLFCNGVQRVEILYKDIKKWGFSVAYISSAKEQCDRLKAIDRLKRFKCKVLVSSDLTSRGIDAENVDLVINFDLSFSTEVYMHRVGRAGRYGTIGVAASIITNDEIPLLQRIEKEGSFKTFKLPDPLPEDLILYPPHSDFVIDDTDLEDADSSEVKKFFNSKKVKSNSGKKVNPANGQLRCDFENEVNEAHENVLSEPAIQSVSDEMNIKNVVDKNDIAHSNFEIIKTVSFNEETIDKKNETESHNIYLDENKESVLPDDCYQNVLNNNESVDIHSTCDIIKENPSDLCDTNVFRKQDIINDDVEKDVQSDRQFSNDLEKDNLETDNKKSNEIDNVPESCETNDVKKTEDDSTNCEQESNLNSDNTLNNMIQTFINTYELNKVKSTELNITPKEILSEVSGGKKFITVDTINNLKSQKNEYLYKILKEFQEGKDGGSNYQDKKDQTCKSGENNIELKNKSNSVRNLIGEEINVIEEDNFEFKEKACFPEKPNFESTPQLNGKMRKETIVMSKPVIQNKLVDLFQALSEESDSSENSNEVVERTSFVDDASEPSGSKFSSSTSIYSEVHSDTEAVSSADLSESESSSDESDSSLSTDFSVDEGNANVYHHDYSSTGRQNPSLMSNSSRQRMHHSQISAEYPQNHQCSCCGAVVQCKPQRGSVRSPNIMQGTSRDSRQRNFDENSFVPFDYRDSASYSGRTRQDFVDCDVSQRRSRPCCRRAHHNFVHEVNQGSYRARSSIVQQNFGDKGISQSYFPGNRSRCHRSRISRNVTRPDVQNRIAHTPRQRSSRHHHTLSCFMPTGHRCHPNTPDYSCDQGEICEMWYKTYYNQWLHIQNVVNN